MSTFKTVADQKAWEKREVLECFRASYGKNEYRLFKNFTKTFTNVDVLMTEDEYVTLYNKWVDSGCLNLS